MLAPACWELPSRLRKMRCGAASLGCNSKYVIMTMLPRDVSELSNIYRLDQQFQAAATIYAKGCIEYIRKHSAIDHLNSTEANRIILAYVLYLDYFRDRDDPTAGATLTRVQEYCSTYKLAGARKVAALLSIIRAAGYCTREVASIDARIKVFVPTAKAIAALTGVLSPAIESVQLLERTKTYTTFIDSHPRGICSISGYGFQKLYLNGIKTVDGVPSLRQFVGMSGGLKLLFSLYYLRNTENFVFSSGITLSRSFGMSRSQVQRFMSLAQEHGHLRLGGPLGHKIELLPPMIALIEEYISIHLATVALGAREAVASTASLT